MTWKKKKVTVVVKAYPEPSRRYGTVVCIAGITDEDKWIRLYPVPIRKFTGPNKIRKFYVIEVECKPDKDYQKRKESHKIRPESIKIIDEGLTLPKARWNQRNDIVKPVMNESVEDLIDLQKRDRTSIGMIRPTQIMGFTKEKPLKIIKNESWAFVETLDGEKVPIFTKMEHIFKYQFRCSGCQGEKGHNMQCEDWELFESYRRWGNEYNTPETLWTKLEEKFLHRMIDTKDLHFILGTHNRFPTWFIIGLYYPPKEEIRKKKTKNKSLLDF